MPERICTPLSTVACLDATFSPLTSESTAGFCAPPSMTSSPGENSFETGEGSGEICPADPQSPYAQKLFAENPPQISGKAEVGVVSGQAEGCSHSTGEVIVEGIYAFLGTVSFLYQLFD